MLQDDNAEWNSLSLFSPATDSQWTMEIWSGVVPALAHLWLHVHKVQISWPFRLGLLLQPGTRQATAQEFADLPQCCCPRGILALHNKVDRASVCETGWFLTVVRAMAAQVDFER